jgi:hypothetical protein
MLFMTGTVLLFALTLGALTLFVVRSGMVSLSFNRGKYESIVGHFRKAVAQLEKLAKKEEEKAANFLNAHLDAKEVATKASTTAANIGKLLG